MLKCVLLLIAQLSNYFCAHYGEKWQYWKKKKKKYTFSPLHCTHWHLQEHKCLVKKWMKIRPNLVDNSVPTVDYSKEEKEQNKTTFALL